MDESLKATVTKGIVSAIRTEENTGLKLIQSDVDIQVGKAQKLNSSKGVQE